MQNKKQSATPDALLVTSTHMHPSCFSHPAAGWPTSPCRLVWLSRMACGKHSPSHLWLVHTFCVLPTRLFFGLSPKPTNPSMENGKSGHGSLQLSPSGWSISSPLEPELTLSFALINRTLQNALIYRILQKGDCNI